MPKGPNGQKRPADVIGNAILIGRIATGEIEDELPKTKRSLGGKKGGEARAASLSQEKRKKIAQDAAKKRWQDKS